MVCDFLKKISNKLFILRSSLKFNFRVIVRVYVDENGED